MTALFRGRVVPVLGVALLATTPALVSSALSRSGAPGHGKAPDQASRQAVLEIDRMESTEFPPESWPHRGQVISIQSAFAGAGITMNRIFYDDVLPDKNRIALSEMDAIYENNVTWQDSQDTATQWFSYYGIAKNLEIPGVLGIMYDVNEEGASSDEFYREWAFGFYDAIVETLPLLEDAGYPAQSLEQYLLWTSAHETGHAYNQHHEDYWFSDDSCFYSDSAIMGYSYDVANTLVWDFGPNTNNSLENDPEEYVRPGHGYDFYGTKPFYPYADTRTHRQGHHWTYQFSAQNCETAPASRENASDPQRELSPGWKMTLVPTSRAFGPGEPVTLRLTVQNVGPEPMKLAALFKPDFQQTLYRITGPDGKELFFHPAAQMCTLPILHTRLLAPGATISEEITLNYSRDGVLFDRPGEYRVRAQYWGAHGESARIDSPSATVVIRTGSEAERAAAALLTDRQTARLVDWESGDHLTRGLVNLETLTRNYPDTDQAAVAHFVLGSAASRAFFDGRSEREPRFAEAARHFEKVRTRLNSGRWEASAHLRAQSYLRLADAYEGLRRPDQAQSVLQELSRRYAADPTLGDAIGDAAFRLK